LVEIDHSVSLLVRNYRPRGSDSAARATKPYSTTQAYGLSHENIKICESKFALIF